MHSFYKSKSITDTITEYADKGEEIGYGLGLMAAATFATILAAKGSRGNEDVGVALTFGVGIVTVLAARLIGSMVGAVSYCCSPELDNNLSVDIPHPSNRL